MITTVDIARVAHEMNRAYCASIGDNSQLPWDEAPDWQKQSAVKGVEMHLANPDTTPEQSHEAWMAHKAAEGWVYGEVKDPEAKTHPAMLPYDQLPTEQRTKDHLFKAVVMQLGQLAYALTGRVNKTINTDAKEVAHHEPILSLDPAAEEKAPELTVSESLIALVPQLEGHKHEQIRLTNFAKELREMNL